MIFLIFLISTIFPNKWTGIIALVSEYFRQGLDFLPKLALVPQRDHLRIDHIKPCQHGGISRSCGDIRAKIVFKTYPFTGYLIDVRRGITHVAITAKVVWTQWIDSKEYDVLFFAQSLIPLDKFEFSSTHLPWWKADPKTWFFGNVRRELSYMICGVNFYFSNKFLKSTLSDNLRLT